MHQVHAFKQRPQGRLPSQVAPTLLQPVHVFSDGSNISLGVELQSEAGRGRIVRSCLHSETGHERIMLSWVWWVDLALDLWGPVGRGQRGGRHIEPFCVQEKHGRLLSQLGMWGECDDDDDDDGRTTHINFFCLQAMHPSIHNCGLPLLVQVLQGLSSSHFNF